MRCAISLILLNLAPQLWAADPIFRPRDRRPKHDDAALARMGIRKFESKYLRLYSDVDNKDVSAIPAIADQLYASLEKYFGKLPDNPEKTVFQVTGYVIKDKVLFEKAGLLTDDIPPFHHGRHIGQRFWMFEQKYAYYRRHLVLHEFTHCFMTIVGNIKSPIWYLEGMAEVFATHKLDKNGKAFFGVMPDRRDDFAGWGRILLVSEDIKAGKFHPAPLVMTLPASAYLNTRAYAWSWALCYFFKTHPLYAKRFRATAKHLPIGRFAREFRREFEHESEAVRMEWNLFARSLRYGFQHDRAWVKFRPGIPVTGTCRFRVSANRGWQSAGLSIEKGKKYRVETAGQFSVAQQPRPWLSEAMGVTLRYVSGRPIGELHLLLHEEEGVSGYPFREILIGGGTTFTAPANGTMYFRLNDSFAELDDNQGSVRLIIEPAP